MIIQNRIMQRVLILSLLLIFWPLVISVQAGTKIDDVKTTIEEAKRKIKDLENINEDTNKAALKAAKEEINKAFTEALNENDGKCSFGRFSCNLLVGVEFSQEKEKFSQANLYLQFNGDTMWGNVDNKWSSIHTFIDLTLASIPTKGEETTTDPNTGKSDINEFAESEKSFIGSIGGYWKLFYLPAVDGYTLFVGPMVHGGVQMINESLDSPNTEAPNKDKGTLFWNVGIRIGESKTPNQTKVNPILKRYLDFSYGGYENFGSKRVTTEGLLQDIGETGLFIGFKAIVFGDKAERDDFRVFTGLTLPWELLKKLIPAGLQ